MKTVILKYYMQKNVLFLIDTQLYNMEKNYRRLSNSCCKLLTFFTILIKIMEFNKFKTTVVVIRIFDHVSQKNHEHKCAKAEKILYFHYSMYLIRLLESRQPEYLYEKFGLRNTIQKRNTTNCGEFNMPSHTSAIFHRSFSTKCFIMERY